MFSFKIYSEKYVSKAKLSFILNNKEYSYDLQVYSPDCDQYQKNLHAYYFIYEKINEYGAKIRYTEYVNCFDILAININSNKKLALFDLNLNKELTNDNKEKIQDLFLKLSEDVLHKISIWFKLGIDVDEIEKETYYVDDIDIDIDCEGGYLNYLLCPTLLELFNKYGYDISLINYRCISLLKGKLENYSIDSRGDGMGEIVIDYSNYEKEKDQNMECWMGSLENYPISQLLQLKVFIPTWNKYRWCEKKYTEEEITKKLYDILFHKSQKIKKLVIKNKC